MVPNCPCPKDDKRVEFFLCDPSILDSALAHHSSKEGSSCCGERACKPTFCSKTNQNSRANTHDTNRWLIVSSSWSQWGQRVGCGRPRRASLSAVQHLLCAANHIKKRHFLGAQFFQIRSQGLNVVEPMKKASYADFAEYLPDVESCHTWASSTPVCRITSERISHSTKNSVMIPTVWAPWISAIQPWLLRASSTVLLLSLLLLTDLMSFFRSTRSARRYVSPFNCPSGEWRSNRSLRIVFAMLCKP